MKDDAQLLIALSSLQHDIWSHWMKYQSSCCVENEDGSLTIPIGKVNRWKRQSETSFYNLSAGEQLSDVEQAQKVLAVLAAVLD